MTYTVKEIFLTQQGEGVNIGRTAVFIRFSGCNLACSFCDTDFVGGEKYETAEVLADATAALWKSSNTMFRFAVLTGGEPMLQVDTAIIHALRARNFDIAVETNGTHAIPAPVDWVCVSPKAGGRVALETADEIKLAFPQPGAMPDQFAHFVADHYWLSPIDGPDLAANTALAVEYCRTYPRWRLAIQAHKTWSIP